MLESKGRDRERAPLTQLRIVLSLVRTPAQRTSVECTSCASVVRRVVFPPFPPVRQLQRLARARLEQSLRVLALTLHLAGRASQVAASQGRCGAWTRSVAGPGSASVSAASGRRWARGWGGRYTAPCPTLCDPIEGSPPGSPIPGVLQARTLEWVAISFSNV